ncbi:hypothetical protein Cgig2_007356 [Carnegiea gigantea]|uniref:At1g61320/AtMIF1 LRR domain-containing protein n=1 Tax=Carnegiea gigantea TaxID=171969 RepID=A0A9Q1QQS9_9CARY|nr:hypothetical protein Cgig2_007356 [Carnegiea gigantea]
MRKNVKELKLNFSGYTGGCPQYPFYLDSFRRYAGYPSVQTLVSLSLVGVSISGYFLESVLFKFPNLEHLMMKYLKCGQGDLIVVGDLLKLRYLEISSCHDYSKLEMAARNLVSIVNGAYNQDVKFHYVPLLSEASFSGPSSLHWIHNLHHSGFLSQLTKLTLTILIQDFMQYSTGLPQFGNLKQFEVLIFDPDDKGLLASTHFIYACPVLHKFKQQRLFIEPTWRHPKGFLGGRSPKVAEKHHHSLKIFEMVGFGGAPADIEFVLYQARCAVTLEKVLLDPHLPFDEGKPSKQNPLEQIDASRKQAKLLQNQLPARVRMEVL